MNVYLKPKNIVIIGGASGIGFAAADRLLEAGASNIILASRNPQKLKEAQSSLKMKAGKGQGISTYIFDIQNV
ncbi:MAG TPA: SDR family NAD(P)-dependent oxidoreductase [Candidatus Eisenbergiella merdavium]|uniref:SDR family NAD(P)-dependent oxidoreductase n=1 Tax=Candidatus Eisenbergiella merdavium TaxID=2838551 RepID=A0A9D2NJQ2_9FIRM|nr:SDR family NAD(P)-dependent oxidoreductase [Candidatus Eisenbergiella merdavium]